VSFYLVSGRQVADADMNRIMQGLQASNASDTNCKLLEGGDPIKPFAAPNDSILSF